MGTQAHAHTYIHRNAKLLEKGQKLHILDIPPVCIDILQAKTTCEKPQNSPPQRPDPSQVAVTWRGSRSSPQKETPGPDWNNTKQVIWVLKNWMLQSKQPENAMRDQIQSYYQVKNVKS